MKRAPRQLIAFGGKGLAACRTFSWTACALVLLTSGPAFADNRLRETGVPSHSSARACIEVAALQQLAQVQKEPARKASQASRESPDKEVLRPMANWEIRQLIRSMEPVSVDTSKDQAMQGLTGDQGLSEKRTRVLLEDATLLLVELQIHEIVGRLGKIDAIGKTLRHQIQKQLQDASKAFDQCAQAQFAGRGGNVALEQSREIVASYRADLERVILKGLGPKIQLPPLDWLNAEGGP